MSWSAVDPLKLAAAALLLAMYLAMCALVYRRHRRRSRSGDRRGDGFQPSPIDGESPAAGARCYFAYASQTGLAEHIAREAARRLSEAGCAAQVLTVDQLDLDRVEAGARVFFVLSTCGEGDAPDNATAFSGALERMQTEQRLALAQIHYSLLALGDRSYRSFCGFGRWADERLCAAGAVRLFPRIDVDRADPAAVDRWLQAVSRECGVALPPVALESGPQADWAEWQVGERQHLNPDSLGGEVHRLRLLPPAGAACAWQSGDVVQVAVRADPGRPRDYSIASIAADGYVELLVRRMAVGARTGLASGWLTRLGPGDRVSLRVCTRPGFRLGANARAPLILIGNGTGIAGLMSHLRARAHASASAPVWLLFGERRRQHDFHFGAELSALHAQGTLTRLDVVFSRDLAPGRYVQDALRAAAKELRRWVDSDAAIYVCGSRRGMANEVDRALVEILGVLRVEQLRAEGRYRRDVY